MLTYRNTNILFGLILLVLAVSDYFYDIHWVVYLLLVLLYSLVLFYGCAYINSNFFLPVICAANTIEKEIAISFDDGPVEKYTPQILQILNEHDVKAAFFCIGNRIKPRAGIFEILHKEGHLIGNHSYSHHFFFDLFSSGSMLSELQLTNRIVEEETGLRPKLFRPPYGVINPNLKKAIERGNYTTVGWSVRSMDTRIKDEARLLEKINNSVKPGAVFLFHDTSATTLAILPSFIQRAKENGYKFVRLDKMLNVQAYA